MEKIIAAGSFLVLRLKRNCDPLIVKIGTRRRQYLVGRCLSEIDHFLEIKRDLPRVFLSTHPFFLHRLVQL